MHGHNIFSQYMNVCLNYQYTCVFTCMCVCVCDLKFQNLLVRQRTFPWLCDYLVLFFPEIIEMLYLVYYP